VRHLANKGARSVLVANRSYDRAVALAAEFGGGAVRFEQLAEALARADIVVSSTGAPHTILQREDVAAVLPARGHRPLFLIDIAVPRDIDARVQELDNVYLYNVDHLEAMVRENVRHREQELARCQAIIQERTGALMARLTPPSAPAGPRPLAAQPAWLAGAVACPS
jgi:glutamyl-tRNA reductase